MTQSPALYDRRLGEGSTELRCEWCGRPGDALPFHVQTRDGEVEFAEPVLCAVCQGLLGYFHPHRKDVRHEEERERARAEVVRLLTERFVREGRPRPMWAQGPTWTWPPRRPQP